MRTFELNIFIERPLDEVYEHLAQPINMIGLYPGLTTIDVLKEQKDAHGIILRPFNTVQSYYGLGLPILRKRFYWGIRLTRPYNELEFHIFTKPNINLIYDYLFQESEVGRTHLIQKFRSEDVNKLLENLIFNQAIQAQRIFLANLKVRLEKS